MASVIGNAPSANALVQSFLDFLHKSPSPYHAVYQCRQMLMQAGFQRLDERQSWDTSVQPGGRYFFERNGATIVAFTLGKKYQPGQGCYMIGAHTDSPCLRVRPKPNKMREGYNMLGVSVYGGGIWHTWFDRDLGAAGKVIVRDSKTQKLSEHLVQIPTPVLRVPSLALHLDRSVNEDFKFNAENQLLPVLGLSSKSGSTSLHDLLYQALSVSPSSTTIVDSDLCLYDIQPPSLGGANQEFIFSARLDNLFMSWCALQALLQCEPNYDNGAKMIVLFDHEEVGSQSTHGADSDLLSCTLARLQLGNVHTLPMAVRASFMVSADVAHAVHPNYADRHEELHKPMINQGMVIKTNFQQRYATSCTTSALLKQCFKMVSPNDLVEFVVRNDTVCGTTIGPIIASRTGVRVVDVGLPVLSMHSIREMGGVHDIGNGIQVFCAFFNHFYEVDSQTAYL